MLWSGNATLSACIFSIVAYPFLAYLVIKLAHEYNLAPTRTTLPATFFLLGCGIFSLVPNATRVAVEGVVQLYLFSGAYSILLKTYREYNVMGSYFIAFVLVGAGTLITPQLLWAVPLLIASCSLLHSVHWRTVAAAVLGVLFVYWMAFGILFLTDNTEMIPQFVEALTNWIVRQETVQPFPEALVYYAPAIWILLLLLPGLIATFNSIALKVRARTFHYYFIVAAGIAGFMIIVQPTLYTILLPLLLLIAAIIGSLPFTGHYASRWKNLHFLFLLIYWIAIVMSPLWMPYITF